MFCLKNENIVVREFRKDDIENKVKWINDKRNNKYLHYDIPLCEEKTLEWYKNKAKNRFDCVIEYQDVPIGWIGLIGIDDINQKAEFYITIGNDEFKRRGIATRATKLILEYAFKELNLNKVYLNVDEENEAACKLYEKIGFNKEGRFVQDMLFRGVLINRLRYAIFKIDLYEGIANEYINFKCRNEE